MLATQSRSEAHLQASSGAVVNERSNIVRYAEYTVDRNQRGQSLGVWKRREGGKRFGRRDEVKDKMVIKKKKSRRKEATTF